MAKKIDKDLFERTKEIVENVKDCEIELQYDNRDGANGKGGNFTIAIDKNPSRKGDAYTGLERNLSHILFDTPFSSFNKQAGIKVDLSQIPADHKYFAKKALTAAYESLEKQRCEQNYGKIYRGTKIHFEDELDEEGKKLSKIDDPLTALEAARQGRDDLIRGTKYESAIACMEGIVGSDNRGAIIWGNKYWEEVLKDWIQETAEQSQGEDGSGEDDEAGDGAGSGKGSLKKMDDAAQKLSSMSKAIEKMDRDRNGTVDSAIQGKLDPKDDFEKQAASSQAGGKIIIEDIIQKMSLGEKSKNLKLDNVYEYLIKIERHGGALVQPDIMLAAKLQEFFRKIKGRKVEEIDDSGLDFDLDEAIQDKFRKSGMIYLEEEQDSGLAVVIAVDLSGSMSGIREQGARNICATLFKAIKGIPKVEVKVVGWSSPSHDYGVAVNDITREEDLDKLTIEGGYGENGNHLAMQYAADVCKKMRGHKKLVIFLTDGVPHMNTGTKGYSMNDCIELSRLATIDANKKGISTLGVYIDFSKNTEAMAAMDKMFLGRYVNCSSMEAVKTNIIKEFALNVAKVIK